MTDQANPALGKIEDLFKDLVWDQVVKAALAALFVQAPALAVWPVGPIIQRLVGLFSGKLFDALKLVIDVQAIAFVNNEHATAFSRAALTLKIIAHDKGIDSDEFKKAKELAKDALAKFVHFGAAV